MIIAHSEMLIELEVKQPKPQLKRDKIKDTMTVHIFNILLFHVKQKVIRRNEPNVLERFQKFL